MVQYLEVPKSPTLFTTTNNLPSYRSSNTRSIINGFYSSSARDSRDFANLSSYTRRSNSDYALPQIYQPTPPMAQSPPSLKRCFTKTKLSSPIRDLQLCEDRSSSSRKLFHSANQPNQVNQGCSSTREVSVLEYLHIFGGEFIGTAILLFVGCCQAFKAMEWTFAVAVIIAVHIAGPISGAHLNPGATIVAIIMNQLPNYKVIPVYWLAQFSGAIAGYGLHHGIVRDDKNDITCLTSRIGSTTVIEALLMEFLMSLIFFLSLASVFDNKNKYSSDTVSLKFGLIISGIILTSSPAIGVSMNTARTLAPALFLSVYDDHWIYWVGPNVGAVVAGCMYRFLFLNRPYLKEKVDKDMS